MRKKLIILMICFVLVILLNSSAASADNPKDKGSFEKVLDWVASLYHKFFPEKSRTEVIIGRDIQQENPEVIEEKDKAPDITQQVSPSVVIPPSMPLPEKDQVPEIEEGDFEPEEKAIETPAKKILLKSRQFVPDKGISEALKSEISKAGKKRIHVLMQFEHTLSKEERKEMEDRGVKLVAYIPDNAWYVSIDADKTDAIMAKPFARSMDIITTEDKISSYIREDKMGSWALHNGFAALVVEFHEDIPLDEAEKVVKNYNGIIHNKINIVNALVVSIPKGLINKLAEDDSVQWIEEIPPKPSLQLGESRPMVGGDIVQAAPYNLTGIGVNVLIYDGGQVDNDHPDLIGRVTNAEIWFEYDHSTHVAGIVGGDGSASGGKLRGMAPAVNMVAYDIIGSGGYNQTGNTESEYYEAINTYGIDIATNSWGYSGAENGYCSRNGDYTVGSELFDKIVNGSLGKKIPVVFSAGNDRNTGNCVGQHYNTITEPSTAKNVITVGAINSDDNSILLDSSFGPTDDGRTKPDLVAPGCQFGGDLGINSTVTGGSYDIMCGTSMAAPHVTGSIALMLQQYWITYGYDPLPSTTKALLLHSADDYRFFPTLSHDPDYKSGYGLLNVTRAIDIIKYGAAGIKTGSLANGENDTYYVNVSGLYDIKATLVWDDPAGAPFAVTELVNNLDLVLIDPAGVKHYPWVLNPGVPNSQATRGVDSLNNIEQVYNLSLGNGIWQIVVKGTSVNIGPQSYSLVSEGLVYETVPPGGDCEVQITITATDDYSPDIYGDKVTWDDYRNGNWDIYIYNLTTSTETQITSHLASQQSSSIYADKIVYEDQKNGNKDIYMYDFSTSTETRITNNTATQEVPAIFGDKIVWQDSRNGNYDIYMYDLSTSMERRITNNTANQMYPDIYGDKIVWQDNRNGNYDIYMYNLSTSTERRITTSGAFSAFITPTIYGNKIIYEALTFIFNSMGLYDLSTSTQTQVDLAYSRHYNPKIYGDKIVWYDNSYGNNDIYMYDLSTFTKTRITTNTANQSSPRIYGDKIVWQDNRNGNWDIYMVTLAAGCFLNTPPSISIPDKFILEDTGFINNYTDLWLYANDSQTADNGLTFSIMWETNPAVVDCWLDSNRYLDCNTKANMSGYSDIMIKVQDPQGLTDSDVFRINVIAVNDPPWISPIIPNQTKDENSLPWSLDLSVYEHDVEDSNLMLDWSVSGVNTSLFTTSFDVNLNIITFTPVPNAHGSDIITLTVTDSNASTASQDITVTLNPVNTPPTSTITSPANNNIFINGTEINFIGQGTDAEDGNLTGSALQWYSDIDGNFGSGETIAVSILSVGYHLITLNATDSGGLSSTDLININITPAQNVIPTDDLFINSDTILAPGTYNIPDINNDGVIIINASNIVLDCNGAEIIGSGSGYGISGSGYIDMQHWMDATNDLSEISPILDNMTGFIDSINFIENVIIRNCKISGYETGINLTAFRNLDLYNNNLYDNIKGLSYVITYLSRTHNNKFYNNQKGAFLISLNSSFDSNEMFNNSETGVLYGCLYCNISDNTAYNNGIGIGTLGYYNKVFNNNASGNGLDNNIKHGIGVLWSNGTEIFNNIANNNGQSGIGIGESVDVKVYNNIADYNDAGITVSGLFTQGYTQLINISNNTARYNSRAGIILGDGMIGQWLELVMGGTSGQGHHVIDSYVADNNLYNIGSAYDFGIADGTGSHIYNNTITQNNFDGKGVYDVYAGNNIYCVAGIGNSYAANATIAPGDCFGNGGCTVESEIQITTTLVDDYSSTIYGDKVTWDDYRTSNWDIYMYNLTTSTESQITSDAASQQSSSIYSDKIVYEDQKNGNKDIYMYDLSTSTETQITTNAADHEAPVIYGDNIIWQDFRNGNYDIYMYNLSSGTETQITTNTADQIYPSIYEDRIVWYDNRNGNYDIYMYNLSSGTETQITTNAADQEAPVIYGDNIIWQDFRNGDYDIYMYNLSSGTEIQITTNTADQMYPDIYGNKIVWQDNRNINYDIYMYDLSASTETQITTNAADQMYPDIYGNKMVWMDSRNGNYDIYMATLSAGC